MNTESQLSQTKVADVRTSPHNYGLVILGILLFLLLYLTHMSNYLLFHSLAEMFSVAVAGAIFMIAWNSRRYQGNDYFLFIGIAFLFVGALDMLHMLAYKGMGLLDHGSSNAATQVWIASRYIEGFSLVLSPLFFRRQLRLWTAFLGFTGVTLLILASIFVWKIFPVCYTPEVGVTVFKKVSELAVTSMFVLAMVFLARRKSELSAGVLRLMLVFILFRVFAELSFIFYTDVYGLLNFAGHLLKIAAYYALYKAIVEIGIARPYDLIFRYLTRAEEELTLALSEAHAERSNWRAVFEAAPFGIALLEEDLQLIQSNDALNDMFQIDKDSASRKRLGDELKCISSLANPRGCGYGPECSSCMLRMTLTTEIPKGHPVNGKEVLRTFRINGKDITRWLLLNAKPIVIEGENNIIVTIEDISDRKRAEQMKNEFFSVVSHELRTPLTSIMGSLGLISGGAAGVLPGNAHKMIDIAHRNSKRLMHLLNDILDMEKINSGRMTYNFQLIDLLPVVEQTIELTNGYSEKYNVEFSMKSAISGKAMVYADSDRIVQVIINLLSNAAKFSPPGDTVEISVGRNGSHIRVSVTDHGPAIKKELASKLFEPFYQLEMAGGRRKEGSGLGLSICKSIIEQHKGRIGFFSGEENSVTFHFDLPECFEGPRIEAGGIDAAGLSPAEQSDSTQLGESTK